MEYIIRGLTFALIPIIVSGVLSLLRRPKKAERGKVFIPKFFAILGSICSGIFLIPTFICAFSASKDDLLTIRLRELKKICTKPAFIWVSAES